MRKVIVVNIERGLITTDSCGKCQSIKEFFADKPPAKEVFPVKGWNFSRVYLTHGSQENGSGWAFY